VINRGIGMEGVGCFVAGIFGTANGTTSYSENIGAIGLSLFKFGAPVAGTHWGIGGLTIALIILFSQYMRDTHRAFELFPIMLGILLAWGSAWAFSASGVFPPEHPAYVSTEGVQNAPWFRVPGVLAWGIADGWPVFGVAAIVGMLAGYIASIVESVGDYYACARLAGAPVPDARVINRGIGMEGVGCFVAGRVINRGIGMEGVGCFVAGIFGTANGTTSYSENIGAIGLTRVGSRRVVQVGAVLMIVLATFGKFGALFTTIPQPIVGGMYCAMFGMIASVGLSNLQFVDLNSARNLFILGFAFFMGLSVPEYFGAHPASFSPGWLADVVNTLGGTGMAVGAITSLVLDNTIPGTDEERGLTAWQ
jgi:nucleobase transporter 1/2